MPFEIIGGLSLILSMASMAIARKCQKRLVMKLFNGLSLVFFVVGAFILLKEAYSQGANNSIGHISYFID